MVETNLCDVDKIVSDVSKSISKLLDDVDNSFDSLAFKIGGNFLTTVGVMLAGLVGGSVMTIINTIILDTATNLGAALLSAVTGVLTMIEGADLVFQYFQVKSLAKHLEQEISLINILNEDIDNIIDFFKWYLGLAKTQKEDFSDSGLEEALKYVTGARNILDAEVKRITVNSAQNKSVKKTVVSSARQRILQAVDKLTGGYFLGSADALSAIVTKYNLKTKPPKNNSVSLSKESPMMITWLAWYADTWEELNTTFFRYEHPYGTPAYDAEKLRKTRLFTQILREMIPEMPQIMQGLILQQMFSDSVGALLEKIPLWTEQLSKLDKFLSKNVKNYNTPKLDQKIFSAGKGGHYKPTFNGVLNQSQFFSSDLTGAAANGYGDEFIKPTKPTFFTDSETKDLDLKKISGFIKIFEAGILAFPAAWRGIMFAGSIELNILEYTIDSLNNRINELNEAIVKKFSSSRATTLLSKSTIAAKLVIDAQKLRLITGETSQIEVSPGISVSGDSLTDTVARATICLTDLKQMIMLKSYDFEKNKAIQQPVDKAYVLAQKTLSPLVANILILFSPKAIKKAIANLQAIKLLWGKQLSIDRLELLKCNEYIKIMESNSAFMALKTYIENFLDSVGSHTSVGKSIEFLKKGEMSGVLDVLNGVETLNAVVQSGLCVESVIPTVPSFMDTLNAAMQMNPFDLTPDANKMKALQKEIKDSIGTLSEQKEIMQNKIIIVQDNMKRHAEMVSNSVKPMTSKLDIKSETATIGSFDEYATYA